MNENTNDLRAVQRIFFLFFWFLCWGPRKSNCLYLPEQCARTPTLEDLQIHVHIYWYTYTRIYICTYISVYIYEKGYELKVRPFFYLNIILLKFYNFIKVYWFVFIFIYFCLLFIPAFFSMCTRPFVFSRAAPLESFHFMSISFCVIVVQKIIKESFTKCVMDGVDGLSFNKLLLLLLLLPLVWPPLVSLSFPLPLLSCPHTATAAKNKPKK